MRRQGHYGGDLGGAGHHAYGAAAAQLHQQQHPNSKPGYYQGRHQDQQSVGENEGRQRHQNENQWRWERDGGQPKLPQTAMSPTAPYAEGKGHERDELKTYYQGQRPDSLIPFEKEGGGYPRSQPREEDMDIGYEDIRTIQTFDGIEQIFLEDIMKLSREQNDAEDAENARHRERLNAINEKYQEQLVALRAQHANFKEEFLRRESQARKLQYDQIATEQYPNSVVGPGDPRGYNDGHTTTGELHRSYNSDYYDSSSRERGRFQGNARDHEFEPRVPYPRGRAYDTGPRHY